MSAPIRRDGMDDELLRRAEEAAERWDGRRAIRNARKQAMADENYLAADSPARLALRVNHLIQDVRRASRDRRPIANQRLRALAERDTPIQAGELDNALIHEAVVGARDFLSVEFLERGLAATRSVGRILMKTGSNYVARGTGFLVAPGLLMTNHHVLTGAAMGAACVVEMDYEQNWFGEAKIPQTFPLEPSRFFLNDQKLDYALIAVAPRSERGREIESYGWLPLISAQGKIALTGKDYINVIQHPLGREKEVVLRDNRVLDLRTGDEGEGKDLGPFLHYEADTEKGSSGAPVLNDQWEVIALHHSGVPCKDKQGNWLDKDGKPFDRATQNLDDLQWVANEGVRVSSLVAAIQGAAVQPHERDLLDRFLSASPPSVLGPTTEAEEGRQIRAGAPGPQSVTALSGCDPQQGLGSGGAVIHVHADAPQISGSTATFELPLRISVTIGATRQVAAGLAVDPDPSEPPSAPA